MTSSIQETTARLLDGKAIAAEIQAEVAAGVSRLTAAGQRRPKLVVVLVGDDPASHTYVTSKGRACGLAGIESLTLELPASVAAGELASHLDRLNADDTVDGILVQLPLPGHLPEAEILRRVAPEKDVDGFHPENVGRLWLGESCLAPATPSGIHELLRRSGIELAGKRAVVVGRSNIVGKPMAGLLLREHATVTICHSRTRDLAAVCREADILVAAIGRPAFIGPEHVAPGAVVIDVGINRVTDASQVERLFPDDPARRERFTQRGYVLVGDVDFHRVLPIAGAITPVPGGVGPLTVASLLVNTLRAWHRRQGLAPEAA